MRKLLIVICVMFALTGNMQAQREMRVSLGDLTPSSQTAQKPTAQVVTLYNYLHIYPEDIGEFPSPPNTVIAAINSEGSYGYNDWRIPNTEEMALLIANRGKIAGLAKGGYMVSDNDSIISGKVRLVSTGKSIAEKEQERKEEAARIAAEQKRREEEQKRKEEEQKRLAAEQKAAREKKEKEDKITAAKQQADARGLVFRITNGNGGEKKLSEIKESDLRQEYSTSINTDYTPPVGWRFPTNEEINIIKGILPDCKKCNDWNWLFGYRQKKTQIDKKNSKIEYYVNIGGQDQWIGYRRFKKEEVINSGYTGIQCLILYVRSTSNNVSSSSSNLSWRDMLIQAITTNPTQTLNNGKYKGQKSDGSRNGLGAYTWTDTKDVYFGKFAANSRDGYGIYIIGNDNIIANCPKCKYYVGNCSKDNKQGKGTCYDETGKLIYYGDFTNDKPTGTYPITGYDTYKFEVVNYNDGNKYIGETKEGKRSGKGIYVWIDGGLWYGEWKDGIRSGFGIYITKDGTITTGTWNGDNYSK